MGIGLCEYRATIGAFAWIATNAGLHWRGKSKPQKSSKLRAVGGEARCEKGRSSNVKRRWRSLDGRKTRDKSEYVGRRSKTLSERELRHRGRQQPDLRTRSQSHVKRRKKVVGTSIETFKSSCVTCKTKLFDEKWQRGRIRQREKYKGTSHKDRHCSHNREGPTNQTRYIEATKLHFLTSAAATGCLLEQAIFTVVQMLLIRSGIETNPGPTTPTSSPCCNASQHFNRVKNSIAEVQKSFRSKVTQETLTKKVVEIEETGT